MVEDLDDRGFADMLAAIWERHGWDTEITEQGGEYMVAGDKPDGMRGLILVAPGDEGTVGKEPIQTLQSLAGDKGIDVPVAATRSSFTDDAENLANTSGIHLVDPVTLEETASAKGFEDLLKQYSGSGLLNRLRKMIPLSGVPGIPGFSLPSPGGSGGSGRRRVLVGAGVLVGVFLLLALGLGDILGGLLAGLPLPEVGIFDTIRGIFGGLPIPDLGIFEAIGGLLGGLPLPSFGSGGGYEITAVSLTEDEANTVNITWDATTYEVIERNGTTINTSEGRQFLVVSINASNPTAETVQLNSEDFFLNTEEGRLGPQPIEELDEGPPIIVPPIDSQEGYLIFDIRKDAESGTLMAQPQPDGPAIRFERNRDMEFDLEAA